jgi:excisionase family DNA binding protein
VALLNDEEPFWDVHQVAEYLNVSESWVYLQAAKGALPCRKFGGLLRFKPSEMRAFAESAKPRSGTVVSLTKGRP